MLIKKSEYKNKTSYVQFGTANGFNYGFNIELQKIIFLPKLMSHLINLYNEGVELEQLIDKCDLIYEFDDKKYAKQELRYSIDKIYFLEESGLFKKTCFFYKISKQMTPEIVFNSLANTKHIGFEVTEKCNLKCLYCIYGEHYNHYEIRNKRNLPFDKGKLLFDYILKHWNSERNLSKGTSKIISFYGGEPLLNFEFIFKMVSYINSLKNQFNFKIIYNITTNGIFLKKYIDFLFVNDFKISISLDGNDFSNQYRLLKNGKPSYYVVLNNNTSLKTMLNN